jgi:hypothetical protein
MAYGIISDGSILGTLCAGGLTLLAGVGLPILLLPESDLAPIIGFICAPPAGLMGAVLGSFIERQKLSLLRSCLIGALVGTFIPAVLILRSKSNTSQDLGSNLFVITIAALIFGAAGALVQIRCSLSRK